MFTSLTEADEDGNRDRVSDSVITSLKKIWAEMSPEERTALTADRVKELEARRENRAQGIRNVPLAAFHDTRVTLQTVFEEVRNPDATLPQLLLMLSTAHQPQHSDGDRDLIPGRARQACRLQQAGDLLLQRACPEVCRRDHGLHAARAGPEDGGLLHWGSGQYVFPLLPLSWMD